MQETELRLIETARQIRLLTRKQADMIREELELAPGETAGALMLRRHYVTEEQLAELEALIASGGGADPANTPAAAPPAAPPPSAARPAAPPAAGGRPATPQHRAAAPPPPPQQQPAAQPPAPPQRPAPQPPAPQPQPAAQQAGTPAMPRNLPGLLHLARHWGASDLHITVGRPAMVRINGTHRFLDMAPLTAEETENINFSALTDEQIERARADLQLDFALELRGIGRYRCNIFHQRLGWDGSYRIIPNQVPTIEQLGLPPTVKLFTEYHQGLVMITGASGSGKTSTAYALLDLVNQRRKDHIITVEDPVEYILPPKQCQVMQREVGRHTRTFGAALRAALREDPDIILVGELRDYETTSIAISAAETGHLVFGTLGTSSAARTVARIVDAYPASQQEQVCTMVAESLRGVITQLLLPRKDNRGRVLAYEILVNTSGIAQQIKDGKSHLITSLIQNGKRQGMVLMDESLRRLHAEGLISGRTAYRYADNKTAFEPIKDQE